MVEVGRLIDEEVIDTILQRAVGLYRLNQFMRVELSDQAQLRIAIAVIVYDMRRGMHDTCHQSAGEIPFGYASGVALNGAERYVYQSKRTWHTIHGRCYNIKANQQAVLVFNNLWLCTLEIHVVGIACTNIANHHGQLGRFGSLNGIRQRVITDDMA